MTELRSCKKKSTEPEKSEIFTILLLDTGKKKKNADLHFEYATVKKGAMTNLILQITEKNNYLMLDMVTI